MSRQLKWQLEHMAQGLCRQCSEPALPGRSCCARHLLAKRMEGRKRTHYKGRVTKPCTPLGFWTQTDVISKAKGAL